MKKIINKKFIFTLIILIIIIGVAITAIKGLNFDVKYQNSKRIELYLDKNFEISDIKSITDEVMPNQEVVIQKVEVFGDTVLITAKDISDEQKQNIITKVNEKYGTSLNAEEIEIESVPNYRGRDIVKRYIKPLIITTAIIIVYMIIRFRKLGVIKTICNSVLTLAIVELMYVSILAITRIPVCDFTMPFAITLYVLTILIISCSFEKNLERKVLDGKNSTVR